MRIIVIVGFGILMGLHGAIAQKTDAQEMADYLTRTMAEHLSLSENQKKEIAELNLRYSERQLALMNRDGSMLSKKGEMKQIRREKNAELELVLTEKQIKKLEEEVAPRMRKGIQENMRRKKPKK